MAHELGQVRCERRTGDELERFLTYMRRDDLLDDEDARVTLQYLRELADELFGVDACLIKTAGCEPGELKLKLRGPGAMISRPAVEFERRRSR